MPRMFARGSSRRKPRSMLGRLKAEIAQKGQLASATASKGKLRIVVNTHGGATEVVTKNVGTRATKLACWLSDFPSLTVRKDTRGKSRAEGSKAHAYMPTRAGQKLSLQDIKGAVYRFDKPVYTPVRTEKRVELFSGRVESVEHGSVYVTMVDSQKRESYAEFGVEEFRAHGIDHENARFSLEILEREDGSVISVLEPVQTPRNARKGPQNSFLRFMNKYGHIGVRDA